MPIEREFKYVMHSPCEAERTLLEAVSKGELNLQIIDINQGYLSKGGRIRSKSHRPCNGRPGVDTVTEYVFTYKHRLMRQPGALEIECNISKHDFDLAWEDADHRIEKTRYVVKCTERGVWEIDFFRHQNKTYLALAEFEVPADQGPPTVLHPIVQEYLMFAVPEADDRFQNRKLVDPRRVGKLLKEIA